MIKIHHSYEQMKVFADEHFEAVVEKERDYLSIFKVAFPSNTSSYTFLEKNIKDIITGDVKELLNLKEKIEQNEDFPRDKDKMKLLFYREGITKQHITEGLINKSKYFKGTLYNEWNNENCLKHYIPLLIEVINEYINIKKTHAKIKNALLNKINKLNNNIATFNFKEIEKIINKTNRDWNKIIRGFSLTNIFDEYIEICNKVKKYNKENEKEGKEGVKIYKLFEYKSDSEWRAKLFFNLNINSCLYCNRQYIHYDEKAFGTTLDHFYDKDTHPYFALSLYNLIPSCYSCNSLLKKTKPFCSSTHLHPYEKGFEDILQFRLGVNVIQEIIDDENKDFEIKLVDKSNDASELVKARKNEEDFCLEQQYQIHKPQVRDLLNLSLRYPDLETAYKSYSVGGNNLTKPLKKQILKVILGVFLEEDELHKETLSKLKRDIIREYHPSHFNKALTEHITPTPTNQENKFITFLKSKLLYLFKIFRSVKIWYKTLHKKKLVSK